MFYKYHESKEKYLVNIDAHPSINNYTIDLSFYDLIILGGGSLYNIPYYLKICEEGINKNIPVVTWGTGVDGFYRTDDIETINLLVKDFNKYKKIYEKFDYISVRGPFTKTFLHNMGLERDIHEIGDPAIAYFQELFGNKLIRNDTSNNILINWGTSYNNIFGNDELIVESELAKVIKELISRGYLITVYPIWTEDIKPVERLVQLVNDHRCQAITQVYEAKILQGLIADSYMTINLKLHANILSASANRPFISLAYRGKCFDFAESINCTKYAVSTDNVTSDLILNLVQDIEKKYSNIRKKISQAKNKYYPKLLKSIQAISEILNAQQPKQYYNIKNVDLNVFNQTENIEIIKMVSELIETVNDGLEHIIDQISQGKLNQTTYLFEDVCEAFSVIESSLGGTSDVLNNPKILSTIESIKNILQKSVNAFENRDEMQLEMYLLINLKNEFSNLYNSLQNSNKRYLN